jgi:hypothetical protein
MDASLATPKAAPSICAPFFGGKVLGSKGEPLERHHLDSAPREDTAAAKRIAIVESEPYAKRDAAVIAQLDALPRRSISARCWSSASRVLD